MRRLLVAMVMLSWVVPACGGDPCKELMSRVCSEIGEEQCQRYRKSFGEGSPSEAQQNACKLMLQDEENLKTTIEGIKRASKSASESP